MQSRKGLNEDLKEDNYFDEQNDDNEEFQQYLLEQKYFYNQENQNSNKQDINMQNEELDTLEEFMNNLNDNIQENKNQQFKQERFLEEDIIDNNFNLQKQNEIIDQKKKNSQNQQQMNDSQYQNELNESEDDFYLSKNKKVKKKIEQLPAVDHSKINYRQIIFNNYIQHQDIKNLSKEKVEQIRQENEINIGKLLKQKLKQRQEEEINIEDITEEGYDDILDNPIVSFGHLNLIDEIIQRIVKLGYKEPTGIQKQGLVCGLRGKDIVGIAKTGSGKTLVYLLPLIMHILKNRRREDDNAMGLILLPSRELSQQVFIECRKLTKYLDIRVVAILGGENKHSQWKQLKKGVDIVIATPGRIIEMIKKEALFTHNVSYLCLDECDTMLDLGFGAQIQSILNQVRPDKQLMLFTATLTTKCTHVLYNILNGSKTTMMISIGKSHKQLNLDVHQHFIIVQNYDQKVEWLEKNIQDLVINNPFKVLMFVNTINKVEMIKELVTRILSKMMLQQSDVKNMVLMMHGDILQQERTRTMNEFKRRREKGGERERGVILISTDLSSRGLDVKDIDIVVNLENSSKFETHIHRIGRTGRAGKKGQAYTLILANEHLFLSQLINSFHSNSLPLPSSLLPFNNQSQSSSQSQLHSFQSQYQQSFLQLPSHKHQQYQHSSLLLKQSISQSQINSQGLGFNSHHQSLIHKSNHISKNHLQQQLLFNSQFNQNIQQNNNPRHSIQSNFQQLIIQDIKIQNQNKFIKSDSGQLHLKKDQNINIKFEDTDQSQLLKIQDDIQKQKEKLQNIMDIQKFNNFKEAQRERSRSRDKEKKQKNSGWDN